MHTIHFNGHNEHYWCSEDAYSRFAEIVEESANDSGLTFCQYKYNGKDIISWKLI